VPSIASPRRLLKLLRSKCGFRQRLIAVPRSCGCQRNRQRITTTRHQGDQPPTCGLSQRRATVLSVAALNQPKRSSPAISPPQYIPTDAHCWNSLADVADGLSSFGIESRVETNKVANHSHRPRSPGQPPVFGRAPRSTRAAADGTNRRSKLRRSYGGGRQLPPLDQQFAARAEGLRRAVPRDLPLVRLNASVLGPTRRLSLRTLDVRVAGNSCHTVGRTRAAGPLGFGVIGRWAWCAPDT
jgi:hypothetical protein